MATTETDTTTAEGRLDLATARLIGRIVQIIQSDFELRNYEAEHLAFVLAEPNFFEFWFSGRNHGSYKVFAEYGIPFVWNQNGNTRMDATNVKIAALFP